MQTLNRDEHVRQLFDRELTMPFARPAYSYSEETQDSRSTPLPWVRQI
ncbi:hypothetical protein M2105_003460 [Paenibacillus sp. PastF-1]|nr:hypothetical protein [Paenibacillus sp. PastF-2]MDF9849026.1 hypothetical protein [Paenibacillus sp. PastM-2]MDF9855596.1 hypothetical protein [Paenibacillus sp. PastF-1]MDH6480868.1 hypothetical protein [Paenibacillus sp. PastH-2]MDH6508290.1 hypothetical protein [Paenibacillus sp. PastM-3]